MKAGDLVRFIFAKTSTTINSDNISHIGILLNPKDIPVGSWIILLDEGIQIHADITEIEVIGESR